MSIENVKSIVFQTWAASMIYTFKHLVGISNTFFDISNTNLQNGISNTRILKYSEIASQFPLCARKKYEKNREIAEREKNFTSNVSKNVTKWTRPMPDWHWCIVWKFDVVHFI
jgi:hypothetical protein